MLLSNCKFQRTFFQPLMKQHHTLNGW